MAQNSPQATDNLRTGGQILVDQLRIHGVERVFCVPGESYLAVLDAFVEHHPIGQQVRKERGAPRAERRGARDHEHRATFDVGMRRHEHGADLRPTQVDTATVLALTTDFQGCQLDGICYPPMRRSVATRRW